MSAHGIGGSDTAAALRCAFDASFAARRTLEAPVLEDLLAIRVGSQPYALRMSEIAAIHLDRKFVPLASRMSEMLGVAAFHGVLAPVFDLRALLGYPQGPTPRWVVLARTPDPVALAFDLFEAHLRVPGEDVFSETPEHKGARQRHVRGAVRTADVVRPLIHVASIIEALTKRVRPEGRPEGAVIDV